MVFAIFSLPRADVRRSFFILSICGNFKEDGYILNYIFNYLSEQNVPAVNYSNYLIDIRRQHFMEDVIEKKTLLFR